MIVIAAGMSRSGSTLQYQLIRSLVEWCGHGKGCGSWNVNKFVRQSMSDIHLFKSEKPIGENHIGSVDHAFSIIRNPFDVAVSLYRFRLSKEYYYPSGKSISMNEIIRGELVEVIMWIEFWEVNGTHIIRYEDMFPHDFYQIVYQAAAVLGIEEPEDEIAKIVEKSSMINNMVAIGKMENWFDYTDTMLTLGHIGPNIGKPGEGETYLTIEQQDMILTYAGDFMERHGYL